MAFNNYKREFIEIPANAPASIPMLIEGKGEHWSGPMSMSESDPEDDALEDEPDDDEIDLGDDEDEDEICTHGFGIDEDCPECDGDMEEDEDDLDDEDDDTEFDDEVEDDAFGI